jgi:hypothetical protein
MFSMSKKRQGRTYHHWHHTETIYPASETVGGRAVIHSTLKWIVASIPLSHGGVPKCRTRPDEESSTFFQATPMPNRRSSGHPAGQNFGLYIQVSLNFRSWESRSLPPTHQNGQPTTKTKVTKGPTHQGPYPPPKTTTNHQPPRKPTPGPTPNPRTRSESGAYQPV